MKHLLEKLAATTLLVEAGLAQSDSYEAIRCMVSSALQNQCRVESNDADCYCWIQNLYPGNVVYSMDAQYFQRKYSVDAKDNVTFGPSKQVEMSWQPVAESARPSAPSGKSRLLVAGTCSFKEAAYEASSGALTMTVIRPGFNKSRERFYPADVLRRDCNIFEGAKMFADHQTEAEAKARPEGSVSKWVASVKKVWAESDGTVKAQAVVIDPQFKAKLEELAKNNMLTDMGVSIRAIGEAHRTEVEGTETNYVESLLKSRSVDFVTYAGAGGQVETIEAATDESDVDLINAEQLRKQRPDLVTLFESKMEDGVMKSLEQQLQEANQQITKLTGERDAALIKVTESEAKTAKAEAKAALAGLLKESSLPEKAQERIRKQFSEAAKVDGMKEAIASEQEYIKSFGVVPGNGVRNLGAADNGTANESTAAATKPNLVESFKGLGLTEEEAKLAAKS